MTDKDMAEYKCQRISRWVSIDERMPEEGGAIYVMSNPLRSPDVPISVFCNMISMDSGKEIFIPTMLPIGWSFPIRRMRRCSE